MAGKNDLQRSVKTFGSKKLRLVPTLQELPRLEVMAVEREGQKEGELTLVVKASDPTSCSITWKSDDELRADVADLVQKYLKQSRGIDGVEFLFG